MPEKSGTPLPTRRLVIASAAALIVSALFLAAPWVRHHALPESIILTVAVAAALSLLAVFYAWLSNHQAQVKAVFGRTVRFRVSVLLGVLALLAVLTGY